MTNVMLLVSYYVCSLVTCFLLCFILIHTLNINSVLPSKMQKQFLATTPWNKQVFVANIAKVSVIVDALQDVSKLGFSKPTTKNDRNMFSETLMLGKSETWQIHDKNQIYDRCNVLVKGFIRLIVCFLLCDQRIILINALFIH